MPDTSQEVVYGIARAGVDLAGAPAGIAGAPVRTIEAGGTAAIVSRVAELRATRRDLLAHSSVLQHAHERGPVLPVRFGTVVADETAVVDVLERRRQEIDELLTRFERVVELRVKAYYVEDQLLREVVLADPELRRMSEGVRGLPHGAGHSEQIRLGEAVSHAVEVRRQADAAEIAAALMPLGDEAAVDDQPPAGVAFAGSFLVARDVVSSFDRAMDDLARRYEGSLTFTYVGPLPPHTFVSFESG